MGSVAAAAVEVTYSLAGLQAARKLYERLLPLPPPGGSFFHVIIGIELAVAASAYSGRGEGEGAAAQAARIRRLFDAAADAYGETDSELWLRYMRWDGSGTAQGSIYWRAMKALADPSQFLAAHRESVRG